MTLVEQLGARLEETLRSAIPAGAPVAILDWPAYPNVGDHVIALGQLAALRRLGHPVAHASSARGAPPERLARRLGDVVVLLTGGGNIGDYWPHHQVYRERVLAAFADRKVVQLPQSMGFDRQESLEAAQRAFDGHPDFTLLVRDTTNLEFGRSRFTCRVELSPDGAFALGSLARPAAPTQDVLCLARNDHERTDGGAAAPGAVDWPRPLDRVEARLAWLATNVASHLERRRRRPPGTDRAMAAALEALANRRLDHGAALLSRGRTVVTDRLHGHILALLLGIPHVLANSRSGKVHDFVETWTASSPLVRRAGSLAEAVEMAHRAPTARFRREEST